MHISIATVFPDLYVSFLKTSLIGKAQSESLISFSCHSFLDFVQPKEHIDAPTCGPTPGMVIRPEVVERLADHAEKERGKAFKIFFFSTWSGS